MMQASRNESMHNSRINHSGARSLNTRSLTEAEFVEDFPQVIDVILSPGEEFDGIGDSLSLLDRLDKALDSFRRERLEESKEGHLHKSVVSFISYLTQSQHPSVNYSRDANFSDKLSELQLNWCETMDALDCLLETDQPSFVSLTLRHFSTQ